MNDYIPTHVRQYNIPSVNVNANTFGYKSIDKLKALQTHYNQQYFEPSEKVVNSFLLKHNIKRLLVTYLKKFPPLSLLDFTFRIESNIIAENNDHQGICMLCLS